MFQICTLYNFNMFKIAEEAHLSPKYSRRRSAELYEKNAQTDIIKELFGKAIGGDISVFEKLEKLDKLSNQMQKGIFVKNLNHPANKRKKVKATLLH